MLELATFADRETVNTIAEETHRLHISWRPDIFEEASEYFSQEAFAEAIRSRNLYVAKLSGTVIGYAVLRCQKAEGNGIVERNVMWIDEFAVRKECRDSGIGRVMMEDIHALARAFRCTDLQLNVYPQNDDAVGFCQHCGFQIQTIGMQKKI